MHFMWDMYYQEVKFRNAYVSVMVEGVIIDELTERGQQTWVSVCYMHKWGGQTEPAIGGWQELNTCRCCNRAVKDTLFEEGSGGGNECKNVPGTLENWRLKESSFNFPLYF